MSSDAQRLGRIDFDDLQGERSWSGQRAYNQSQLANVLHPGIVRTGFGAEDPGRIQRVIMPFAPLVMKTPERGALTSISLASSPEMEGVTGQFFANCRQRRSSRRSYDTDAARRLWSISAGLVGLDPDTALTGSRQSAP